MNADFYERGHVSGYSGFIVWVVSVWHQKPWAMTGQFSQQTTGTSRGHAGRRAWVRKEEGTLVIVSYHTLVKLGGFMVLFSTLCFEQFQTYRKVERLVQQSFIIHIRFKNCYYFAIFASLYISLFLSLFLFWPHIFAGSFFPRPGIEPAPLAMKAQSPYCGITRGFP